MTMRGSGNDRHQELSNPGCELDIQATVDIIKIKKYKSNQCKIRIDIGW